VRQRDNCWDFMNCGREPGGRNTDRLGVCPATTDEAVGGTNCGTYAGRFCWTVAGTLCGGRVQGTFAKKFMACLSCPFLHRVQDEEGREFVLTERARRQSGR